MKRQFTKVLKNRIIKGGIILDNITYTDNDIALEGLKEVFSKIFNINSPVDSSIPKFKDRIEEQNTIFSNSPEALPFKYNFISKPAHVDEKHQLIIFKNINYKTLFRQIKESYGEKRLDLIFQRLYKSSDIAKFNKKKISRSQMTITSLVSPTFFALELSILFSQLYKKYKNPKYAQIAKIIYEESWLKKADDTKYDNIDIDYAQNLLAEKYKLQAHQIEFIKAYPKYKSQLNLRGVYLAFDQGLGKTLTSLSLAMALKVEKIYIICPNTLVQNWYDEINSYYEGRVKPYICKTNFPPDKDIKIFIVNNESIKSMLPYIDKNIKSMLIIDEGHNFRNLTGTRVQELLELGDLLRPNHILPMSGTPLKATPNELTPMLRLLDPLFTPIAAKIYNKCFNFDQYQAMEIVTERLGKVIYRKMKSDVLQLPHKYEDDLKVSIKNPTPYLLSEVRKEVLAEYKKVFPEVIKDNYEILQKFTDVVNKYSTATQIQTKWYLSRICKAADEKTSNTIEQLHEIDYEKVTSFLDTYVISNPVFPKYLIKDLKSWEGKLIHFERVAMGRAVGKVYPKRRNELFNAMWKENEDRFIKMINDNEKKTVIFSQFAPVVKFISERLSLNGIGNISITGKVKSNDRSTEIRKFRDDESIRVIVATSNTMGVGITLNEASLMLFFGPPWRSGDYDQCCDRIYRIGQDVDVYIYNVILDTEKINLSSKMNAILKWSSEMFHSALDPTIVTEGYIFNETPIYLNIDKWKNGEINSLYITGLSGSGKGYTAKQYANDRQDVIIVELDKFENYLWYRDKKEENMNVAKGDTIIFNYMKKRFKNLDIDIFANDVNKYKDEMRLFVEYLRNYMRENKYYKFIIEGIQIYCDDAFNFIDNTYPVIVIRTSMVKSMQKVMNREHCTIRNRLHTFIDYQKKLKEFVKRLEVDTTSITNESMISNKLRFETPQDLYLWMKNNFKYKNHTKLQSISQMLILPRGSCHDQVYFEMFYIQQMQLQYGAFFIIESNLKEQGGMTHSFLWYKKDNKYYWFENAWEDYSGIHEFNSLKDIIREIKKMHLENKWGNRTFFPILEIRPLKFSVGDTLQQIVNKTFPPN